MRKPLSPSHEAQAESREKSHAADDFHISVKGASSLQQHKIQTDDSN
ncbi:hypothetical protein CPter91_4524 [Collimonas pratensis]|uniref:Uncharacterized protein n=1 Tax=Collimonas pratensis TaxID=279113 RepID=A0A127QA15_9BURK|nr:hypothetical protein CPter91_4524 [Collimonas pratensis]